MTQTPLQALHERAQAGDGEAMALTAVAAALGRGEPASWPEALERLRRAAGLGSAFAESQLEVLSQAGLEGPPEPPGSRQVLLGDPAIQCLPGFLPQAACDWLISRAAGRLARAETYDDRGGRRLNDSRNNSMVGFLVKDFDLVIVAIRARIALAAGSKEERLESPQVLHYAPGQTFRPHYDFLDPGNEAYAPELAKLGQRLGTFLIYLNTGFEGGETEFPELKLSYRGQPGDALLFANVDGAGAPDFRTLHAGRPTRSGEKWLFSQWIRTRRGF